MNIAVIGGAGFVGSALVRRLVADGHEVVVFDSLHRGAVKNIPAGVRLVVADALDGIPSLHGFDWVYDFAARVYGVRDLYKNPAQLLSDNIRITTASLEAVALAKVPNYFFVSSSCVYDFPGAKVPHVETDTNICDTSYGFSKQAGEQLVRWYARQHGFTAKIARLFNVYGPGDSTFSPHVIPEFIRKAREAKSSGTFEILGLGNQTRDFTFMDDVVAGIIAISAFGFGGEAYNIGTGREVSITALAQMICAEVGVSPAFTEGAVAAQDIQRRAADPTKLRNLGWTPKVALEDGIRRLISDAVTA